MVLRIGKHAVPRHEPPPVRLERLDQERIDGGRGLTLLALMFSLRSHFERRKRCQ
jgi:hypothetical protein